MNRTSTSCRVVVAAVLLAAASARPTAAQIIETPETKVIPKLTVQGEAELRKPADLLLLTVGVVTENREATAALDANTKRMRAVEEAIRGLGLGKGEYETGHFRIRPLYSRRPRQAEPDWQPQIIGYEVSNSLNVRTTRLDMAGALIEAANKAGANSIDAIDFDLADRRKYRSEAITKAARHAREDARTLAAAAGVRLVRLLALQLDDGDGRPIVRGRVAAVEAGPAPITPGDVVITASVTLVYEIGEGEREAATKPEG